MKQNKGIISLTVVIFMMVILVLVLALLQSRILLAIQRTKGTADSILSTYHAESEIYDTLARFRLGFPVDTGKTQTFDDGTQLTMDTQTSGTEQIITFLARLPFATTKLKMSRSITSTTSSQGVNLIVSLDCTGSMKECADPNVTSAHGGNNQWCNGSSAAPNETTKFQELRKGTLAFLTGLQNIQDTLGLPVHVGVTVFSGDSDWAVLHGTSNPIKPDANIPINDIIDTINADFNTKNPQNSPGCSVIPEEGTSHASGLEFMHAYFNNPVNKLLNVKNVEVLVTDGEPTTSIPATQCGDQFQYFIPAGNANRCNSSPFNPHLDTTQVWSCKPNGGTYTRGGQESSATDLAACMITNTNRTWDGTHTGQRDPDIDAYVITTFIQPDGARFKTIMTTEPGVFYYDTDNAENLTTILENDVIENLTKTINQFKIQRVVP